MKFSNYTLLSFAFLSFIGAQAFAIPAEHAECPVVDQISTPENSQGFVMSADCRTVYVLPPLIGQIEVGPIMSADSPYECKAIMAEVDSLSSEVSQLGQEQNDESQIITAIESDTKACAPYISKKQQLDDQIKQASNKLATDSAALRKLQTEEKQDQVDDDRDRLTDLQDEVGDVTDQVNDCLSLHPHAGSNDSTDQQRIQTLTSSIETLSQSVNADRTKLSAEPGGDASIAFVSNETDLVNQFITLNQGLNITFVAMPLKDAQIHFQLVTDGKSAKLASVNHFDIFGLGETQTGNAGGYSVSGAEDVARLFGGAVGSQISLNLYATCVLQQQYGDLSSSNARAFIANILKPTVTYDYEVQAAKDIKIEYNEAYLYQLIKQHTEHGGLFWTSSSDSITESSVANSWLQIVESSEDSNLTWADSEKRLFELRQEVLNAALARVTLKTYVSPGEAIADGGTPPEDGASVASKELHKCPDKYCQAAAFVLDLSNAVFGGSSSTGSATKIIKTSDVEDLVIKGMVTFSGTQTFENGDQQ